MIVDISKVLKEIEGKMYVLSREILNCQDSSVQLQKSQSVKELAIAYKNIVEAMSVKGEEK